ncbi:MAG: hypothetical protein WA323_06875 [Candidatus Nitrosopolaris sp.]|jgi:hypothetical protein
MKVLVVSNIAILVLLLLSYFSRGYEQGKADRLGNNSYNDNPYDWDSDPDGACDTFKTGYAAEWAAAEVLYGNQGR